jgi:peptide/nickel transport system permease protein
MNATLRILGQRLLQALPVILLASFIVFGLMELVPGDIAVTLAGENATQEHIAALRQLYRLDDPFLVRYGLWLWHALHGDLGRSLISQEDVLNAVTRTFPKTLLIATGALLLAVLIGTPLGMVAAVRRGGWVDIVVTTIASIGVALPGFWLGMILVSIFALSLHWFPATGAVSLTDNVRGALWHATLPAIALAATSVAEISRQLRGALVEVLSSQFVRTLHAKGLSPTAIIWRHGLGNVAVTLLTLTGLLFSRLLGATVVMEAVFAIPGLGSLIVVSTINKDFPVIQGVVLVLVMVVIVTNLIVDLLCTAIDPRVGRV